MKIAIFASIGCQNLGDELILKNEIKIFENPEFQNDVFCTTFLNPEFCVFTYDKKNIFFQQENVVYKEYFPIGIKKPSHIFKNIKNGFSFVKTVIESDYIVIGGGGLFYDSEKQLSQNNLLLWKKRIQFFKKWKKKVVFYGISIDVKKPESKEIIQYIFSDAFKICVRDHFSLSYLEKLGIQAELVYDPVLYDSGEIQLRQKSCMGIFPSNEIDTKKLDSYDFEDKTIGLALRKGYLSKTGREEFEVIIVRGLIEYLLSRNVANIILMPHSFHNTDEEANDFTFLQLFLQEKVDISGPNMQDTYAIYQEKKIDICFAMRLHSMVLCHAYQIPYIGLTYSQKTDEMLHILHE